MKWAEKICAPRCGLYPRGEQSDGFLTGFTAPADGKLHIGLLHGEIDPSEARYDPIRKEEIAASGLAYLALGHIHKRAELDLWRHRLRVAGLPGGMRGSDELGKRLYSGTTDDSWQGQPYLRSSPGGGMKF